MFGLFTRPRAKAKSVARRRPVALCLEQLETRDCPSPMLQLFNATPTDNDHQIVMTGRVWDANPTSVCLTFGGVTSGQTYADQYGYFTYYSTATSLGTATAVGVNGAGEISNTKQATVTTYAPTIGVGVTYGEQRTVTIAGSVGAPQEGGLTVTFAGKVTGSTTTDQYGNYLFTAQASALGDVTATVTDVWGQTASQTLTIASEAPNIDRFYGTQGIGNVWTFRGHVIDESPAGLVIQLSGLPELQGRTATVASDGTFSVSVQLANGEYGTATAQTTDWWGLDSDVVTFLVMS